MQSVDHWVCVNYCYGAVACIIQTMYTHLVNVKTRVLMVRIARVFIQVHTTARDSIRLDSVVHESSRTHRARTRRYDPRLECTFVSERTLEDNSLVFIIIIIISGFFPPLFSFVYLPETFPFLWFFFISY